MPSGREKKLQAVRPMFLNFSTGDGLLLLLAEMLPSNCPIKFLPRMPSALPNEVRKRLLGEMIREDSIWSSSSSSSSSLSSLPLNIDLSPKEFMKDGRLLLLVPVPDPMPISPKLVRIVEAVGVLIGEAVIGILIGEDVVEILFVEAAAAGIFEEVVVGILFVGVGVGTLLRDGAVLLLRKVVSFF